jgi:hypothetical protein
MKIRSVVPSPDAGLKKAVTSGRSAEHSRLNAVVPATKPLLATSHVYTVFTRSSPPMTSSVSLSMIHFETKAPFDPCSRTPPRSGRISWFISTVNVPSPLSNAPIPSGSPTIW